MHGDDDQIVPIADSALLSVEAAEERHAQGLRELPARHVHDANVINADLLAFIKG